MEEEWRHDEPEDGERHETASSRNVRNPHVVPASLVSSGVTRSIRHSLLLLLFYR